MAGPLLLLRVALLALLWGAAMEAAASSWSTSSATSSAPIGVADSPLSTVVAVAGTSVLLPCTVRPPTADNPVMLVLVFKGEGGTPIYSVDSRNTTVHRAQHWVDLDQLGSRAQFQVRPGPQQGLFLSPILARDEGLYRCRVDFKGFPSRNIRIKVNIIVPPEHLLITSSLDKGRIVSGLVGPYPEDEPLELSCQVMGGSPRPALIWWEGSSLLDDHVEQTTAQITRNVLSLPSLRRRDHRRVFTCSASNNNLTLPLSEKVIINIAVPPRSINMKIQQINREINQGISLESYNILTKSENIESGAEMTVKAGQEYHLICESSGSRPKAELIWLKNGHQFDEREDINIITLNTNDLLTYSPQRNSLDFDTSKTSVSSLLFVPQVEDDGQMVGCRAVNSKLPKTTIEESFKLKVLYPPQVRLLYESNVALDDLEEGDHFALVCSVEPATAAVQWQKDGAPLPPTTLRRVLGRRLEVWSASRLLTGRYTCAAANSGGATTSQPLQLRIKFTPTCSTGNILSYTASKGDEVTVNCTVDSYPPPLTFRWAFNRSSHLVDIPQNSYSSSGTVSTLSYVPHTRYDFGTLLCWAANDVGLMKEPCGIQLIPAGQPDPVRNCEIKTNALLPASVAVISCSEGWDGGLNQTFTLEVKETVHKHSRSLAMVQHSPIPVFNLKGLKMGVDYQFIITAVNVRSSSSPVTLSYTPTKLHVPVYIEEVVEADKSLFSWVLFTAVVLGMVITAFILLLVAYALLRCTCRCNGSSRCGHQFSKHRKDSTCNLTQTNVIRCGKSCCENEALCHESKERSQNSSLDSCAKPALSGDLKVHNEGYEQKEDSQDNSRDSGCETRSSTPYNFDPESLSSCGNSYFIASGPYHTNSLSPPPTPVQAMFTFPDSPYDGEDGPIPGIYVSPGQLGLHLSPSRPPTPQPSSPLQPTLSPTPTTQLTLSQPSSTHTGRVGESDTQDDSPNSITAHLLGRRFTESSL